MPEAPVLEPDALRTYAAELERRIDAALVALAEWHEQDKGNGDRTRHRRAIRRILEGKFRAPA